MSKNKEIYIRIEVSKNFDRIDSKFISFNGGTVSERLSFYYDSIDCHTIDIVEFSNDLDLIVDDEGLLVSKKPIFEIPSKLYRENLHIAGNFLLGKKVMTPDGINTVGFSSLEEAATYLDKAPMKVKLIGVTR